MLETTKIPLGPTVQQILQFRTQRDPKIQNISTWSKDEFSTTIAYYYTGTSTGLDTFYEAVDGEMEKVSEQQMDKLSPYARLNWSASYRFDWDGKVKVGVKNLTDEMPPYYSVFNGDFDSHPFHRTSRGYSTIGRTVYIGYDQSF